MVQILLKLIEAHPEQAIAIIQSLLDILKSDPALMKDVVDFFKK